MNRLLPFALLLSLAACGSTNDAPLPPDLTEPSAKEGLNDRFTDEEVDVEGLVENFEGESREIAAERDAIVAALELREGHAIADVGAGTGLFMEPLARGVGPEGRVLAIDIGPQLVEFMAERARQEGWSQVEARLSSERSVELSRACVDRILVVDTYHHFEYPRSTTQSLHHALRPGGMLVVVDFERIPGVSREWTLGHVRCGKEETRAELEEAGFEFLDEVEVEGLVDNYLIRFVKP